MIRMLHLRLQLVREEGREEDHFEFSTRDSKTRIRCECRLHVPGRFRTESILTRESERARMRFDRIARSWANGLESHSANHFNLPHEKNRLASNARLQIECNRPCGSNVSSVRHFNDAPRLDRYDWSDATL